MSTPWQIRDANLTREARRFLSAIRRRYSLQEAAGRAGVDPREVRLWLRDPEFSEAYRRARQGGGRPQVISLDQYVDPEGRAELVRAYLDERYPGVDGMGRLNR